MNSRMAAVITCTVVWGVVFLALATGLPTGGGGVSLAADGPDNAAQPRIMKWISRATAINNIVDIGPTGLSPGDMYVFSDQLFSASAPYPQIGTVDGRCVLIDPSAFRFDCSFTSKVQDGDILAAGTLTLVEGSANCCCWRHPRIPQRARGSKPVARATRRAS
jgi:hypothetical protein